MDGNRIDLTQPDKSTRTFPKAFLDFSQPSSAPQKSTIHLLEFFPVGPNEQSTLATITLES